MVTGLRLSHRHQLVVICWRRARCNNYCTGNDKFPGNKSGHCKPGEVVTDRVIKSYEQWLIAKSFFMIKNFLLIALRNLKKDFWYSLLNILGLTIGITFSLFLIFYITDELNYDRQNKKADRIYRINTYVHEKDKNTDIAITQLPLGPTMKKDYPEVEEMVRLNSRERTLFKSGDNSFYETKIYYA